MDQVGADDGSSIDTANATASQYFEAAYSQYNIATVDDFDNSAGAAAGEVHAVVTGWNGYAGIDGVTGLQVNFYMDAADAGANLVGYASSDHAVATSGTWGGVGGDLTICSGSWALNAGINLVAVIPSNEFGANGQTAIAQSFDGDYISWQANPSEGFGNGPYWEVAGNAAYRVLAGGPIDPCDQPLGDCPNDITGEGLINVDDVLGVIGSFGEVGDGTFRPTGDVFPLPNGDCAVTVDDLLAVIGVFGGDCLPTGACCSVDSCVDGVKEADCADSWLGDGSTCAGDCVSGACCADDGSCSVTLDADCAGSFNAGVACADANCQAAPANNSCAGAEAIGDGDTAIDNTMATSNGDADFNICDNFGEEMVYHDLWYAYTATCDGAVTITTCDTVDFDSRLSVYDACGGAQLACNDDCGGSVNGLSSELSVMATTGDTLIIRVGSFGDGGTGIGTMNVSCQGAAPGACCLGGTDCLDGMADADCAAFGGVFMGYGTDCGTVSCGAAGDTCADAVPASDGPNAFDTTDATDSGFGEPDDSMCAGTFLDWAGSPDVWMTYEATSDGTLSVSLCDSGSYDTSLVLYSGSSCSALTQIACNGDSTVESGCQAYYSGVYDLPVSAGTVYIRLGGWQGDVGPGTCTITFTGAGATGACCVAGACVGETTMGDCDALGGLWFNGEMCADVTCPAPYSAGGCDLDENVDFPCVCFVDGDDSANDCNGGSNMGTPTFTALTLGQSICGTSSVYNDVAGLYRDLDWWTNATIDAGGTFDFTIGANSTCLILMVNLDAGTVDWVADHAAGFMNTTALTLDPANWATVSTVSEWNEAWTCGSGLETYTMQVD